jgi:hypothetical protein
MKRCPTCGKQHNRAGPRRRQSYCCACHAAYMRENRPRHSELPPEAKRKANARAYVNTYQCRGKLNPKPCGDCGGKAEKHHEDYSKPLAVDWLCRKCHLALHKLQNVLSGTIRLSGSGQRLAA